MPKLTFPSRSTQGRPTTLIMLAMTMLALATAPAVAAPCSHVTVTGQTSFDEDINAFVGPAQAIFDADPPEDALATTFLLAAPYELPNGMLLLQTMHVFDFGDGDTLSTLDHVLLFPTHSPGVYDLHSSLVITGGTGRFAGAVGHFHSLPGSQVNLILGTTSPVITGTVCVP